jgi:hypothetical protein
MDRWRANADDRETCPPPGHTRAESSSSDRARKKPLANDLQTRTSLCRVSNRSPSAPRIPAGRRFGEARDQAGIFGDCRIFRAVETRLSRVSPPKSREVKDSSTGGRKPELRRTAWWARQDSNSPPSGYRASIPGSGHSPSGPPPRPKSRLVHAPLWPASGAACGGRRDGSLAVR